MRIVPHRSSHARLDLAGSHTRAAAGAAAPGTPSGTHRAARADARRRRRLEPIGPERLRALRQAILNGSYPIDAAVIGGLATMFLGPDGAAARRRR